MSTQNKPTIIYILGLPYSGSTLFSVALGSVPNIVNLGEVNFLENDYYPDKTCLCGDKLSECSFWSGLVAALKNAGSEERNMELSSSGHLDEIDKRKKPLTKRLLSLVSPKVAYGKRHVGIYQEKNLNFFRTVAGITGAGYLVDASKSPVRLRILRSADQSAIKVVWLQRPLGKLVSSRIKRAKRRKEKYLPMYSYLYAINVVLHYVACFVAFCCIPSKDKVIVNFDEFCASPGSIEAVLRPLLNFDVRPALSGGQMLELTDQHIFTGNTWLSGKGRHSVTIRKETDD